jgi:hypothetical protein
VILCSQSNTLGAANSQAPFFQKFSHDS